MGGGGGHQPTISYLLNGNCYLNITSRCTLRCAFCPKFNGSWEVRDYELRLRGMPSVDEIVVAAGDPSQYAELVFCGLGEPTLRLEVMLEVARRMKAKGATVRVNTDGLANLVYGCDVTPRFSGVVDALSISMNAHDAATYERHCRPRRAGSFAAMLEFAQLAKRHVPEVTMTAIDGLEGVDIAACREVAERLGVGFRRRVLNVVG